MALDSAVYLVAREIAQRSGLLASRYRVADDRYVLDNKDLSRVRFTTDEYINGLDGVEKIDPDVADTLIAENGFKMGLDGLDDDTNVAANDETETPETENENQEETISENEVGNVEDVLGDLLGGGDNNEQENNETEENVEQNQEEE